MNNRYAPPLLALSVVIACAADWNPNILTVEWPAGHVTRDPATSPATCRAAADAWMVGRGLPIGEPLPAVGANCASGNGFAAGSEHIAGFNSLGDRR